MSTPNPNPDPNSSTQDGNTSSDSTSGAGDQFKPITSQEDLNKTIAARIERERAKFSDYDDVKAKAARLDEIEAANKSELEKAQDARAAAEKARDKAVADGLRWRIAAKHGVSDEDAELFLTGSDEETLTAQAKRLADREADRTRNGARSPNEGRTPPSTGENEMQAFARGLFHRTD